jgi:hypothetical protein
MDVPGKVNVLCWVMTQFNSTMRKIILLFIGSFLVTTILSASLKVFFESVSWREVLTKGLLIPCFTWTIQLLLSAAFLDGTSRLRYWNRLGWVCLIGSIALLPAAFYNYLTVQPWVWLSIVNVLASVVLMALESLIITCQTGVRAPKCLPDFLALQRELA